MSGRIGRIAGLIVVAAIGVAALGAVVASPDPIALTEPAMVARAQPLAIGVAVHAGIERFGYGIADTAAALAALRLDRYRADLTWPEFQPAGADLPGAMPPRLAAFAAATTARPLYILGHPNPRVANGALPIDPATRAAFARYAAAAVDATGGTDADYEIWNEWNNEPVTGLDPLRGAGEDGDPRSATAYARLAQAGIDAIRQHHPAARILAGADGLDRDWAWISAVARHGGADSADGVSVHVYNHCERVDRRTGDRAIEQIEALRAVQDRDGWSARPIWVTELGWPTPTNAACGVSRDRQADNLAQWLLWAAATPWVGGAYLYQLKDQGLDAKEVEDNFGLFDYRFEPKPAACTVREAAALARAGRRWAVVRPRAGVTLIRIDLADGPRLVAWSASGATVRATRGTLRYRTMCGAQGRGADVVIGMRPVVVDLRGVSSGMRSLTLS